MTFELVRLGWPNVVAVIALAALPFVTLGLPADPPMTYNQVERGGDIAHPVVATSNIAAVQ